MRLSCTTLAAIAASLGVASLASAATFKDWNGSGEFGLAQANGNSKSLNVNAKLKLGFENDVWKDQLFVNANRAKSKINVPVIVNGSVVGQTNRYQTTANHFDAGGSMGYKFDPRAYLIGAARYDHDDFGPNRWQQVASLGFGYILMKDARRELSFEVGPGFKRYQPQTYAVIDTTVTPPLTTMVTPPVRNEVIGRVLVNYQLAVTDNTSIEETALAELGGVNRYYQNDFGVSVAMTRALALKVAWSHRYNSNIVPGTRHLDSLFTTNLVYDFGKTD